MATHDLPDNFQAARVKLSQDRPYLAAALYRVVPVAKPGLGTMAVDAWWRLYFDPTCNWEVPVIANVMYHEVGHLLRDHSGRAKSLTEYDPNLWNRAADAEINDDIIAEGRNDWPFEPCTPGKSFSMPDGLTAEEYYASVPQDKHGSSAGDGTPKPGSGECGGAAGNPGNYEDGPPFGQEDAKGNKGKEGAARGLGEVEADMVRAQVARDIQDASKSQGTVPAWLDRWANGILTPKVDWRKVLAGQVRQALADAAGAVNFTYTRPSRRQVPNVILPNLRRPVPNIAVVVDTSGSMGEEMLSRILGEVNGILKAAGAQSGVDCIVCDANVKSAARVFKAEQIKLAGGGGTDMRVGIEAAMRRSVRPHAIIVLTDGYTPWPSAPIGPRVIAAIVGAGSESTPDWIKTVRVDEA